MSDKQPGATRRGATGEDASARDWVGADAEAPAADVPAADAPAADAPAAEVTDAEVTDQPAPDAPAAPSGAGPGEQPTRTGVADQGPPVADPAAADAAEAPPAAPPRAARGAALAARLAARARRAGAGAEGGTPASPAEAGGKDAEAGGTDAEADRTDAEADAPRPAAVTPAPATEPASPQPAAPAAPPEQPAPRQVVRATGPPRRPPMIVQGLWPAALGGALVGASVFGLLPLAVAVLGVQVFLILGALALLDAPASGGIFLVATGATLVGDAVVLADDGSVAGLAGAAGVGLVAALLHQLLRKGRSRVTESLADTFVVLVVSLSAACLLALRQVEGGEDVLLVGFAAAGAVLLAGRIGDSLAPRPMLAVGSTRGWPGLVLGLGAGVAVAVLVANADDGTLPLRSAALIGLVVASTVATADLAVDLGAAELRAGWRDARRVAALRPTALLLPYAVLGPIALLAGRLVLA